MEKHLLPKALPFWKKNSHISSNGLIRSHGELLVGEKKKYPKQAEPSNDEPTNAKSLFQFPEKKKHRRTSFFGVWVCFFGGKKPPNLRNINSSKKNISPWAEHPSQLLGGQLELSLVYTVKLPGLRDGSQMFLRLRAWRNLAAFCCTCFSAKTQELACGGEGVGQKNFEQSALFSRNLVEKTNWNFQKNMNSQWIDHSIVFED